MGSSKISLTAVLVLLSFAATQILAQPLRLSQDWARNVDSSTSLNLKTFSLGFVNSTCTGSLISPKGHVLVARHCIESALAIADQVIGETANPPVDFVSHRQVAKDFTLYPVNIKNVTDRLEVPVGLNSGVVFAKIFAVGPGWLNPRFTDDLKGDKQRLFHKRLSNEGYSVGGDFAIVQIDELADRGCFKLSSKSVRVRRKLHMVSFPCYQSSGDWPQRKSGHVKNVAGENGQDIKGAGYDFFLPKGNFASGIPGQDCNSGSAFLNEQNEIVGVLHSVFSTEGHKDRSIALSIQRLLQLIPEEKRDELLQLNAECGDF